MTDKRNQDERFLSDFRAMSEFGATSNGGVDRQAATIEDDQVRNWLQGRMIEEGFEVRYDAAGNQFALLEVVPGAPYVLAGSHLDSQPLGGKYDGAYGVLAAAHAGIRLKQQWEATGHSPKFNYGVVNWFNEEGARFKPSMMGSAVFTGKLPLEVALDTKDPAGVSVREAFDSISSVGTDHAPEVASYAEIHIEQGRHLDNNNLTIGLVPSTWGANKYQFVVHGEQAHTGATMIADRKDALLGASMLVVAIREIANQLSTEDETVVTSCGEMHVLPNSPVVVPREVSMLLDIRSTSSELLTAADAELARRVAEIETAANVVIEKRTSHAWPSKAYQPEGLALAEAVVKDLELSHGTVRTVAGHDSTNMKDVVPTVMLFVPSVEGISHNEREYTTDEDIVTGTQVLTALAARMCDGELVSENTKAFASVLEELVLE